MDIYEFLILYSEFILSNLIIKIDYLH